jgi:hypothetical protein
MSTYQVAMKGEVALGHTENEQFFRAVITHQCTHQKHHCQCSQAPCICFCDTCGKNFRNCRCTCVPCKRAKEEAIKRASYLGPLGSFPRLLRAIIMWIPDQRRPFARMLINSPGVKNKYLHLIFRCFGENRGNQPVDPLVNMAAHKIMSNNPSSEDLIPIIAQTDGETRSAAIAMLEELNNRHGKA